MVRTFSYKIFLTGLIQFLNIFELNNLISTKCYVKIIETLDLWGVFLVLEGYLYWKDTYAVL
jgi:hypothetical protein